MNEELYDPEPPQNSSYLRIIHAGSNDLYDVSIDGKIRIRNLKPGLASEYLILPSGIHQIEMANISHSEKVIKVRAPVVSGHSFTYAFLAYADMTKPEIFDDISTGSRLKAQLMVYNISSNFKKVDLLAAGEKKPIFEDIDKYASRYLAVNPVEVNIQFARPQTKKLISNQSITLIAGRSLSIFLLSIPQGGAVTTQQFNAVEKYQRK
jgi:hypothetical protein